MVVPDIAKQKIALEVQKSYLQNLVIELYRAKIACKKNIQELHDAHISHEIVETMEKYYDSICKHIDDIVDKIENDCIPAVNNVIDGIRIDRFPE